MKSKRPLAMLLALAGALGLTLAVLARASDQAKAPKTKVTPDVTKADTTKVPADTVKVPPGTKYLPACDTVCGGVWSTSGNQGGDAAFLGTTDATPLVLRTNNQDRIRIDKYDSVRVGLVNLSGVFGTLTNRQAVIHLLKGQENEATSNAYLNNPQSGVVQVNGHVPPPAGRGRLEVSGLIRTSGDGGGVMFPDGTVQTTAQLKGDPGPEGKQGATGPEGKQGPPGAISFYFATADLGIAAKSYATSFADCNPGDFVTGGGYGCPEGSEKSLFVYKATPVQASGNRPAGFQLFAVDTGTSPITCKITAVCAHIGQ